MIIVREWFDHCTNPKLHSITHYWAGAHSYKVAMASDPSKDIRGNVFGGDKPL